MRAAEHAPLNTQRRTRAAEHAPQSTRRRTRSGRITRVDELPERGKIPIIKYARQRHELLEQAKTYRPGA